MGELIPYAPLCEKQQAYIIKSLDSWLNVAEGGKRAGKNIMNLMAWAAALDDHEDKIHLAAGVSIATAKLNIIDSNGFGLLHIFDGSCRQGEYEGRDCLYFTDSRGREKVVLISGGGKVTDVPKIKGNTYGSVYVTEANECHPEFIKECFTRTLTSSKRKVFHDLNPEPPSHWYYQDVLDPYLEASKAGTISGVNYQHFTVADNLSISDEKLAALLLSYPDHTSLWYLRDIKGQRTSASGRIYKAFHPDASCLLTAKELQGRKFQELAVGVDVGGTDATVATLCGIEYGYASLDLIDGFYHKQGISDKMDEATYARMIVDWLVPWAKTYPFLGTVYVDSAAKLFRTALNKELLARGLGRFVVRAFDKSDGILERIEMNCILFAQGRFKIASHMKKWIEAYQMAVWDEDEYANKKWVRVDDGSYPIDCLDSAEYGFFGYKRYFMA